MKQTKKQMAKRLVACGLCVLMLAMLAMSTLSAYAADTLHVTVRMEGAAKTYYNGDVSVSAGDSAMQAVVAAAKAAAVELTGVDAGYISAVAGETAGAFGGWDGWMYRVNGKDQSVGLGDYKVADGDEVVLFYGGYPCQFPQMKQEGTVLTFTSEDTQYDEQFNATVVTAPVVGATVTVNGQSFTTDDKGQVDIAALADGTYTVQIEKKDASGAPAVVRLANVSVTLARTTAAPTTTAPSTAGETAAVTTAAPVTAGDGGSHALKLLVVVGAALVALCLLCRNKTANEE